MRWAEIMRYTIALDASFFNAQRMLMEYLMYAHQDRRRPKGPSSPADRVHTAR